MDNQNDVIKENANNIEQNIFADSTEELENNSVEDETESNDYKLSSGDALNEKELYLLTAKKDTKIIYVLGPVGSGKTTLETMLYECFLKNLNDDLVFAGSETLLGFEERLNYLRVISGNSDANMERTYMNEERCFLHLNLLKKQKNENCSIVFTDISGEIFDRCSANKANLEEDLKNLDLAQNIVLFMDGFALLDRSRRHEVVSKIRSFLLTLKSSKLYRENCNIDIMISKNDIIYEKSNEESLFIENIHKKFEDLEKIFKISFFRIEALNGFKIKDSDKSKSLIELLKYWLDDSIKGARRSGNKKEKRTMRNEFNRFGEVY